MSNNTRAPTKDEIRAYYETHNISLKKLAEYFSISENTVKSWKARDKKMVMTGCNLKVKKLQLWVQLQMIEKKPLMKLE